MRQGSFAEQRGPKAPETQEPGHPEVVEQVITPFSLKSLQSKYPLAHSSKYDFMEVFSPDRLGHLFQDRGFKSCVSMDLLEGWDLSKPQVRKFVVDMVKRLEPQALMLSPPCTTFSSLFQTNKTKLSSDKIKAARDEGLVFLKFSMELARIQHEHKRLFCFEHPATATSWDEPCVTKVRDLRNVHHVTFHQCMFGLVSLVEEQPHRKATRLLTNAPHILAKFDDVTCDGSHVQAVI